jgi:hypothetical protein
MGFPNSAARAALATMVAVHIAGRSPGAYSAANGLLKGCN